MIDLDETITGWVSGLGMPIKGKGKCLITMKDTRGNLHHMTIHDVLYTPDLDTQAHHQFHRLFSVTEAVSKGWGCSFGSRTGNVLTHIDSGTSFPLSHTLGL